MRYITRTAREIYPVWTEDTKPFFVDVGTVSPVTLPPFPANPLEDELILTAPLAVDVAVPLDTLHPLEPEASIFGISLFIVQVWIDGSAYCYVVDGRVPNYTQCEHELKSEQTLHFILGSGISPITEGEPNEEGPLQETIEIQIKVRMTINLEDETICVTADPATITVKEENELGVTYAANLIGYILTQDILL